MIKKIKSGTSKQDVCIVREASLEILLELSRTECRMPLPALIEKKSRFCGFDSRDRAFLTELVCGVVRRHRTLDRFLDVRLSKPDGISFKVRMLLRQGVFEILCLDGIPARATVYETAALAFRLFGKGMGGLVNAVLRRISENAEKLLPELVSFESCTEIASEPAAYIAEKASLPLWLTKKWVENYGAEYAFMLARNCLVPAAPSWRVNMTGPGASELLAEWKERGYGPAGSCGFSACGLDPRRPEAEKEKASLAELEAAGRLSRQGVSSQMLADDVALWLSSHPGRLPVRLWDACCGRGGKSCALLEKGVNVVLSSDPSKHRLEEFRREAERLGIRVPEIRQGEAQDMKQTFPYILLDAPCSGTGTIGRNPELRFRLSPERSEEAVRLQRELLDAVWNRVEDGGALFYSTCAADAEENERQTEAFLQRHPEAMPDIQRMYAPFFPGEDAMFLAVFVKTADMTGKSLASTGGCIDQDASMGT